MIVMEFDSESPLIFVRNRFACRTELDEFGERNRALVVQEISDYFSTEGMVEGIEHGGGSG